MDLLIVFVLVVINGVLAASELAIVSARKARLQPRAEEGDVGARTALELAAEPDRFLSTVQIGITLVGIIAGAFGGAALTEPVANWLRQVPQVTPYASVVAGLLVVGFITYLSLLIGELVPKRLALQNPEGIAIRMARPMATLAKVAAPIVAFLAVSSDLVLRLLGARKSTEPPVTEEEVELLLQEGARHGVFAEAERVVVQGVFDLGDRNTGELMTPRRKMVALDLSQPDEENRRRILEAPHTTFPVIDGSPDNVVGLVSVKALWGKDDPSVPLDLAGSMIAPMFVPESAPVLRVLEQFRRAGTHLALVVDEYGGVEGLLTMQDVLDAIAGDLDAPDEAHDGRAVRRVDGSWLLDGSLPAHEVRELLEIGELPGEEDGEFETLGGFIMASLGHVPSVGEIAEAGGWRFEVADMDGNRVDRVLAAHEPVAVSNDG